MEICAILIMWQNASYNIICKVSWDWDNNIMQNKYRNTHEGIVHLDFSHFGGYFDVLSSYSWPYDRRELALQLTQACSNHNRGVTTIWAGRAEYS